MGLSNFNWSFEWAVLITISRIALSDGASFQAAKSQVGLDQHQVRRWDSWHRRWMASGAGMVAGRVRRVTVRPIRIIGDAVLRAECDTVTSFDRELRDLVTDLMDTLLGAPGRAGVAANQIGVSARVFVYDADGRRGHVVNPTIEVSEETQDGDEGCLSIPDLYFPTPRAMHATVTGFDQHGEPLTVSGSGFLARAFQHEVDHLAGRLYVDGLTGQTRREALREIRAAPWSRRP